VPQANATKPAVTPSILASLGVVDPASSTSAGGVVSDKKGTSDGTQEEKETSRVQIVEEHVDLPNLIRANPFLGVDSKDQHLGQLSHSLRLPAHVIPAAGRRGMHRNRAQDPAHANSTAQPTLISLNNLFELLQSAGLRWAQTLREHVAVYLQHRAQHRRHGTEVRPASGAVSKLSSHGSEEFRVSMGAVDEWCRTAVGHRPVIDVSVLERAQSAFIARASKAARRFAHYYNVKHLAKCCCQHEGKAGTQADTAFTDHTAAGCSCSASLSSQRIRDVFADPTLCKQIHVQSSCASF